MFSGLALALYVFFLEHVFTIVNGVGELTDPVVQSLYWLADFVFD